MLTLIHGGEIYAPEPLGKSSILLAGDKILKVGAIDHESLQALGAPYRIIDATDCLVTPGLIDPHQHLIGAGGEQGWGSRTPEMSLEEIVQSGITTVVGCLGTDTTTRNLTALLAKARQLAHDGITAYIYTGGFWVPPRTFTGSVMDDIILIDLVIGVGEIAIADARSPEPTRDDLAQLISQGIVGGMVSGKAGVTHLHVGSGEKRLSLLNALLQEHDIPPRYIYPTHMTRSEPLMDEAIALSQRGAYVDIDTVDDDLPVWLRYYCDHGGDLRQLTVSSDSHTPGGSPDKLYRNFVRAVRECDLALEEVLSLFTRNPASVLQLDHKGGLREGMDADVLLLRRDTLDVTHVFARGRQIVRDGVIVQNDRPEDDS